jgi:hypothetical protein
VDLERVNTAIPPKHEVTIKLFPELTLADKAIKSVWNVAFLVRELRGRIPKLNFVHHDIRMGLYS